GGRVTICARRAERLRAAEAELRARGGEVLAVAADLATEEGVDRVWRAHCEAFERGADILVNNVTGGPSPPDVLTATDADWLASYTMNLVVNVRSIPRALPGMLERGWGRTSNAASPPPPPPAAR